MESLEEVFVSADTRCRFGRDGVLLVSLENPRPRISTDVLASFERAIAEAERRDVPLVIHSATAHFAFGADLDKELTDAARGGTDALDTALQNYQRVMLRLRHAAIPVVAAVRGTAVSGGCEVLMHCTRVVAHSDSTIGLFEAAAGVVPAGGGLKEFARRASQSKDLGAAISRAFDTVAAATLASSAEEAQRLGFLSADDIIVQTDPLETAIDVASKLHAAGRADLPSNPTFRVGGPTVLKRFRVEQERKLEHVELTLHQFEVNMRIAAILCGGDSPAGGISDESRTEAQLFDLERAHFLELVQNPLTQERIAHLRATRTRLMN